MTPHASLGFALMCCEVMVGVGPSVWAQSQCGVGVEEMENRQC